MNPGGQDMVFKTNKPTPLENIADIIVELWPDAVFETDAGELFAYRDADALESWTRDGRTEDNADELIHVLVHGCQVTIVYDLNGRLQ